MDTFRPKTSPAGRRGFTLVELLASMVVLALILVMLERLTSSTQKTMAFSTGRIEQFREARQAFEGITRRLGQATLNTYWDYSYLSGTQTPTAYVRQSELRFISGSAVALGIAPAENPALRPTHAIFFQAPLGLVNDPKSYHGLENLLNTWGYCVEYGDDSQARPTFLNSLTSPPALRYRFRMVEMQEPSEAFSLYQKEAALNTGANNTGGNAAYTAKDWFTSSLGIIPKAGDPNAASRPAVHVLAENIVALILQPKLTKEDEQGPGGTALYDDSSLSPYYLYDSTSTSNNAPTSPNYTAPEPDTPAARADLNPKNQLPSLVQVTMVAVDEKSFSRFQNTRSDQTAPPNFGFPTDAQSKNYAGDLQSLQNTLQNRRLDYRVFTTTVSLKSAKWSRDQTK